MDTFKSGFSKDLQDMIELKIATNHSEKTYLDRALRFDAFCEEKFPNDTLVSETIALEWVRDALSSSAQNAAHSRLTFLRILGQYQKAIGKNPYMRIFGLTNAKIESGIN